jgi:hypothetical protein
MDRENDFPKLIWLFCATAILAVLVALIVWSLPGPNEPAPDIVTVDAVTEAKSAVAIELVAEPIPTAADVVISNPPIVNPVEFVAASINPVQPEAPAGVELKPLPTPDRDALVWDQWIEYRLGASCTRSPYYGKGAECSAYLRSRGREIGPALAVLEFESTFGLAAGSNDFGSLDPRFMGGIEDYCDYLYNYQVIEYAKIGYHGGFSNEIKDICEVYNDGEHWRHDFAWIVEAVRTWEP